MTGRDDVGDATSEGRAGSACFQTTHWSQIRAAADASRPGAEEALSSVCAAYWYPVYAYARGCGLSPEDAQDLTQAFFARVIEKSFLAAADATRGRFRWFLLTSLQNFLRNELDRAQALKRGGALPNLSWDALEAEQRFAAEPVESMTPDLLFDRSWALVVMSQSLERLAGEFAANGRAAVFQQLKRYLEGTNAQNGYEEAAECLGISPAAIRVAVHRLRERFRQLVRDEIARTVSDSTEIDDELRHLAHLTTL